MEKTFKQKILKIIEEEKKLVFNSKDFYSKETQEKYKLLVRIQLEILKV